MHPIRVAITALILSVLTGTAIAQVTTGIPPFGSFGGGQFDTIDLGNLNVHLTIPIINKPGRGLSASHAITYDSSLWTNAGGVWVHSENFGWGGVSGPSFGWIDYATSQVKCFDDGPWYWGTRYSGWTYYDSAGTPTWFAITFTDCVTDPGGGTATANDGSGYTLTVTDLGGVATIRTRSGVTITPPSRRLPAPPASPTQTATR